MRDCNTFTTRRVVSIQHGHAIFSMSASFHVEETGFSHQAKMPEVPPPEKLPGGPELSAAALASMPEVIRRFFEQESPAELRPAEFNAYLGKPSEVPGFNS